jgi:cell wall-associated NlpC family hydrolase
MEAMRTWAKLTVAIAVFGLGLGLGLGLDLAQSQTAPRRADSQKPQIQTVSKNQSDDRDTDTDGDNALNQDDRLSLIAAALDAKVRRGSEPDCSHLVHAIYERAGFSYAYAPSSDLYSGVEAFQRVKVPESGDLVVWRGHVGIVIQPSQHIFFSFMTSGPGIDDYQVPYWKSRGHPRFYRYIKERPCAGCDSGRSRRLLKIKR